MTTSAGPWPRFWQPMPPAKSRYVRPSSAVILAPSARSTTIGGAETACDTYRSRAARTSVPSEVVMCQASHIKDPPEDGRQRATDGAVSRRRRRLRLPRHGALPRARSQGRGGSRPRPAQGDRRRRARLRHPAGHPRHRPRPVSDRLRARGAAGRAGVRRRADLLPHQRRHAGQPRAVPCPGAARRADRGPAQLARLDRRRARAERRAAELRGARVRRRAGHHPLRDARCAGARAARRARRRGRVPRLAHLLRHGGRHRGAGGGGARRRRAAGGRPVVGPALRLQRGAAADRAVAGRRRHAHQHAQDRGVADAERDAAHRRQRAGRRRARSAARCGCCARPARRRC